jgi:hypothetical protein
MDRRPAEMYYFSSSDNFAKEAEHRSFYFDTPPFNDPLDCDFRVLFAYLESLSLERLRVLQTNSFRQLEAAKLQDFGAT